jgi:hypothetical protein
MPSAIFLSALRGTELDLFQIEVKPAGLRGTRVLWRTHLTDERGEDARVAVLKRHRCALHSASADVVLATAAARRRATTRRLRPTENSPAPAAENSARLRPGGGSGEISA